MTTPSQAPTVFQGWAHQFTIGTIASGFVYDQENQIMFVTMRPFLSVNGVIANIVNWFFCVPYGIAWAYINSPNPDFFYVNNLSTDISKPGPAPFHQGLLTETSNELLTENGSYLWIK